MPSERRQGSRSLCVSSGTLAQRLRIRLRVDPRTGAERKLLKDDSPGFVFEPRWSPDGAWVALWWNRSEEGLWVVSADGQTQRLLVPGHPRFRFPIGWSPDSQWVYVFGSEDEIVRVSVAGGEVQPWLKPPITEDVYGCSLSADARQMACLAGGESDVWMIEDFDRLLPH